MDDLYNNAWGESVPLDDQDVSKAIPSADAGTPSISAFNSKPAWLSSGSRPITPSHAVEDVEADLAAPSWSTGAGILWNEPSEDSHGFAWSHTEPDLAWGTSTYDSLQIGKSRQSLRGPAVIEEGDPEPVTLSPSSTTTSTVSETEVREEEQIESAEHVSAYQLLDEAQPDAPPSPIERRSSPPSPQSPLRWSVSAVPPSQLSSPDAFGGFSSDFEEPDPDGFKSGTAGDIEDDTWGSAWANAEEEASNTVEEEAEDEWSVAQRQQEEFNRRIPPGFLDDIKKRSEELCDKITPKSNSQILDTDNDSPRNNLRITLDDMDELPAIRHEYLPDLMLQPPLNFHKTATFRGMNTALKLTRNLPMVKDSPMSHYMASKGSTAWETAVRGRKEIVEEDVVPVGWRILDKDAKKPVVSQVQKPSGRVFSFWGRKDSKLTNTPPPPAHTASASESSSKLSSVGRARSSSERRKSSDSVRSDSSMNTYGLSATSPSSAPTASVSSPPLATEGIAFPVSAPQPTTSYADAPIVDLDGTEAPPAAAPSAVSRFLNRFSRRTSSVPSSSPRQSLALSSDDLEFLSDIVPSVSDDSEDSQKVLPAILHPEPLPPLLAPPSATSRLPPPSTIDRITPPQTSPSHGTMNSYDSFFNALESPPSGNTSGTFPLLGSRPSPVQPSPSIAPSLQSPASLLQPQTKPVTPSPLSSSSLQSFGLPPPPSSRAQTPVLTPAQRQPFVIPPPPPSRSLTPKYIFSPSPPTSGQSSMDTSATMSESRARPKIPAEISIPLRFSSPSSSSSTPSPVFRVDSTRSTTPTSGVPLALLYPNAVKAGPSSHPSLGLALASTSRNHTPSPTPPAVPLQPLLPMLPPPSISKPPPPRVVTLLDDDEDDFADFQSSTPPIQKPVPIILESSYASPSNQSPSSATGAPMLAGPGPTKSSSFGPSRATQKAAANAFFKSAVAAASKPPPLSFDSFDDEFSAFASSSSQVNFGQNSGFDTSGSSLLPAPGSGLDGFDSLSSSPGLRTPSPPKPPAKNLPPVAKMSSSPTRARPDSKPGLTIAPPPPPSASRATRHQHTLSLMQMANERRGKVWPAPPSPLPQALVPPPGVPGKTASTAFDFMGEDDSFGSFNSTTNPEGLLASNSSPATFGQSLLPSSSGSSGIGLVPRPELGQSQSASSAGSGRWLMDSRSGSMGLGSGSGSLQSVGGTPSAVNGKGKHGGTLSAQDLSFFEAL